MILYTSLIQSCSTGNIGLKYLVIALTVHASEAAVHIFVGVNGLVIN